MSTYHFLFHPQTGFQTAVGQLINMADNKSRFFFNCRAWQTIGNNRSHQNESKCHTACRPYSVALVRHLELETRLTTPVTITMTLLQRLQAMSATTTRTILEGSISSFGGGTNEPLASKIPVLEESASHARYLKFIADGLIDEGLGSAVGSGSSIAVSVEDVVAGQAQDIQASEGSTDDADGSSHLALVFVKCFIIGFIILAAILGNMLVIVSVMRHRKLRWVLAIVRSSHIRWSGHVCPQMSGFH